MEIGRKVTSFESWIELFTELAGEADIYTIYYQEQLDALVNARSVTGRLFTAAESADHHCQIGNMGLVLSTVVEWIEQTRK